MATKNAKSSAKSAAKKNESANKSVNNNAAHMVSVNFKPVFDMAKTAEELKAYGNDIAAQLKEQFDEAAKRFVKAVAPTPAVTVTASTKGEKKTEKKATEKKATVKKTKAEKTAEKTAKRIEKISEEVAQIALTDKKAIKALGFTWVDYSEKAFVLASDKDTKGIYEAFSKLGGRPNKALKGCGTGSWVFSKAKSEAEVKKALKGLYKAAKKSA